MSLNDSNSRDCSSAEGVRRYMFSSHGQSSVRSRRFQSQRSSQNEGSSSLRRLSRSNASSKRSRRGKQPYSINSPQQFELDKFARPEQLHSVFRILEAEGGHGPGEDNLSYQDFSPSDIYAALRAVSKAIRQGSYRPYPTREVSISKASGGLRWLKLLRIIDRVVAKALQIPLDRYWRSQLPGIGGDSWSIWADMDRVMRERRSYVLATDDIESCFPSTPLDEVIRYQRQHISQPDLIRLVETVIRGHDGPEHTIGLDQGSPYSPIAMELLLHNLLDARLEAEFQGFPLLLRYVDNLTFVCSSVYEGDRVLQVAEEILADQGFSLKRKERPPMDIRDSMFNRKVLGLIPRWQNGQLTFSIPDSVYDDLKVRLSESLLSPTPAKTAKRTIEGRIRSLGPALVKRVIPAVVDRMISTARDCGFTELQRRDLMKTAHDARHQWLTFCADTGGSERG